MNFDYEKTFQRDGLQFRMRVSRDDYIGAPWDEHEGHGVVSDWTTREQGEGERVLATEANSHRFYDFAETLNIAERDAWGIDPERAKGLTKSQIVAAAVEQDFAHMKAWCDDEWWWVLVEVQLLDTDGYAIERENCQDALGGIESDDTDYHMTVAVEMADGIAAAFKGKSEVCIAIRE